MANPFDQFDTPAAPGAPGTSGPNPFDQFDTPAPAAKPQLDGAGDIGGGIVHGLVNAVTGFLGGPGTLQQAERGAAGNALERNGYPNAAAVARAVPALPSGEDLNGLVAQVMGPLYRKPETTAGQYAGSIAENVPGAMIGPGGLIRKVMEAVVPGVTSETAARVAPAGYEGAARVAGGLAGNLGTAAGAARASSGDRAIVAAAGNRTPEQIRAGQGVQDASGQHGMLLMAPEGIQAANNGATGFGGLLRTVENSQHGGPIIADAMAARPAQQNAAVGNMLDTITPQPANPYTVGPRAAQAADTAIDNVRQDINAATRPDYAAAEAHVMDPADFAAMRSPAFDASLQRLRADPVLGPEIAALPDGSGRVIDLVTKDMGARSQALSASGEGFNPLLAERYGSGAADARDILRDPARGGVQAYDDALTAQAQARTQNLDPLQQGPVGVVARTGEAGAGTLTGSRAAGQAILPPTGAGEAGGHPQLADAVTRIGAVDPQAIADLVRQRMANEWNATSKPVGGQPSQTAGWKYAAEMSGAPGSQQQQNLDAVMGALPNSPQAPAAVRGTMDSLAATGHRLSRGSNTAGETAMKAELGEPGLLQKGLTAVRSAGASVLTEAGDTARRAALGRNTAGLARLFTDPNGTNLIADIVQRGVEPVFANALVRQALQAPGQLNGR